MGMFKEFKEFALRGNVVDLAVGVIIGAAFGKIVSVLVEKVMMPPIGLLTGGMDFSDRKWRIQEATEAKLDATGKVITAAKPDVFIGYGEAVNAVIYFVIVAFCLFLVIKAMNAAMKKSAPPPPPGPTADQKLLTEIRDLLAAKR